MKIKKLFENWDMRSLKIKLPILEMDWAPQETDKNAAWDMYVELLTRITTQSLPDDKGIEQAALDSVHKLFEITRSVLKANGRDCIGFARIAIVILNQIIRPFTAKWHKLSEQGAFDDVTSKQLFRKELILLQEELIKYTKMLSEIADVEDLTEITEKEI